LVALLWLLTIAALFTGIAGWTKARRLARRLERLSESYWELRYEHGQLQSRLKRLGFDEQGAPGSVAGMAGEPVGPRGTTAFVPLSSLKR
jgi:hypothetical protein